jgi:PAS domain S-box-containing protein
MRVKTRLRLNTLVILVIMCLMVLSLAWSFREVKRADRDETLAAEMQRITNERVVLRDDYLLRKEERARAQWKAKTEDFRVLLKQAEKGFAGIHDRTPLKEIRKEFEGDSFLFSRLIEYHSQDKEAGVEAAQVPEEEKRLLSKIIVSSYDLNSAVKALRESVSRELRVTQGRAIVLVAFFMSLAVVVTIGNSVLITRTFAKRISELGEGTEMMGAGDLDHRISVSGNDELADLARASNEMAAKLRDSYTSVDNLEREIARRERTEEELRESEERYRVAIEQSNDGVAIIRGDRHFFVNRRFLRIFGYSSLDELADVPIYKTVHPDDREMVVEFNRQRQEGKAVPARYEFKGLKKDGSILYIEASVSGITYLGESASLAYLRDITHRKEAEETLRTSLAEKEVLLKEIHHRVKNNLQVISSLLNLQAQRIHDERDVDAFRTSMDRIKSMALIHDKLYRSENLARISFPGYVDDLVRGLFANYSVGKNVELDLRIDPISVNIDNAIPLGLIINELVSNALKHAFPEGAPGTITLRLQAEGKNAVLIVADNGIGFPAGLDFTDTQSLGMQLVVTLVEQLEGTVELIRGVGTEFRIVFETPGA